MPQLKIITQKVPYLKGKLLSTKKLLLTIVFQFYRILKKRKEVKK